MSDWKVKFTAELDTTQLEQQVNQKISELDGKKVKFGVDGGNAQKEVEKVDNSIKSATKSTKTFGDTLKTSAKLGAAYSITSQAFQAIREAASAAKEAVQEFDAAVMDLRMATGDTYTEVSNLVKEYNELGQAIGATTKEISSGADSWLRQGHSISDTNILIKDSMILAKVAELESAEATSYLISIMKGFEIEVENVIGIVDRLTSVDLVSAVDAGGIAEGISKTAVSANTAGVSLDKLIGYLAATGEVTQESMSVIGNAFKTFFARYSAIKSGKLELIDEDGTIEVLSDVEQSLKNVGIDIRTTITDFDNAGDVLDNLAEKWDNLNSVQKSAIASAFGGTRQKERFLVLMENYGKATEYMEVSMNSAGTAEQKFEAYLDSLEAKTKSLQASFESLAINTFPTEMFGGIIDATSSIVTFLDKTNLLKGTLVGLTAAGAIKAFTMLTTGITNASIRLNEFNSALKLVKSGNIGEDKVQMLAKMTANLSQSQLKAVLSSKALSGEQRIAILTAQGLTKSEAEAAISSMGLATAEGAATTSTFTLSGAFKGLWATLKANPLLIVVTTIYAIVKAVDYFTVSLDELEEKLSETQGELAEIQTELTSLEDELTTISDKIAEINSQDNLSITDEKELQKLQQESAEIQRQIDLLKLKESIKQGEVYDTFIDTMDKDLNKYGEYTKYSDGTIEDVGFGTSLLKNIFNKDSSTYQLESATEQDYIDSQIKTYQENLDKIAKLNNKYANDLLNPEYTAALNQLETQNKGIAEYLVDKSDEFAERLGSLSYIEEPVSDAQKQVNEMINFIGDFDDRMAILLGSDNAESNAFNRLVTTEFSDVTSSLQELGEQGQVTAEHLQEDKYDEFIDKLKYLGVISDDTETELAYLAEMFNGVAEAAEEAAEAIENTDTSSFTDRISGVASLSTGLDQLKEIYLDVKDKGDFDYSSILNNEDFKEAFGDLGESYDNFIKTITESPNDISACQSAFNSLATEYINTSGKLEDLTEDERDATVALLEQMGVANAAAVIDERIALSKKDVQSAISGVTKETRDETIALLEKNGVTNAAAIVDEVLAAKEKGLIVTTTDLTDATWDEINALYNEATAGSAAQQALAQLLLEKWDLTKNPIDTSDDIEQLIALANAAGVSAQSLVAAKAALDALNTEAQEDSKFGASRKDLNKTASVETKINNAVENVKAQLKNLGSDLLDPNKFIVTIDEPITYTPSNSDSGSGSSSSDSDTVLDKFKDSVSSLFDWIEIRLERLQSKTEKYISKAEKYLEDGKYASAGKQYKKALSSISSEISTNQKGEAKYATKANEILYQAISEGLIDSSQAKSIKEKIKDGTIDITKYGERMQTVIEEYQKWYEKSLDCSDNVQTLLDQYQEYAEALYTLPIEKATAKIEELEEALSLLDTKAELQDTAEGKNAIIDKMTANAKQQKKTADSAEKTATSNVNSLWKSKALKEALKTEANYGSEKGKKLSTAGLDVTSNAYKAVIKYNEALEAQKQAQQDAEEATLEYTKALRENAKEKFDNVASEYESETDYQNSKLSLIKARIDSRASLGYSATSDAAKDLYKDAIEINNGILTTKQNELAALKAAYEENSKNMSAEDKKAALTQIKNLKEEIIETKVEAAELQKELNNIDITELNYALTALQRDASKYEYTISKKIASGKAVTTKDYDALITNADDQIANHKSTIAELKEQQKGLSKNSEEYQNILKQIEAEEEEIRNLQLSKYEWEDEKDNIALTKHGYNLAKHQANASKYEDVISLKEATGQEVTAEDYKLLIRNSENQVSNLEKQNAELVAQQVGLSKDSEKYQNLQRQIEKNEDAIRDAEIAQAEWNAEIANLPIEKIEKELELLDAIDSYHEALLDLKKAQGKDLSEQDYLDSIANNEAEIEKKREERKDIYNYYLKALADESGVYGGKSADEWLTVYNQVGTEILNIRTENEKLKDELRDDVYWRDFEKAHEEAQRLSDTLSGLEGLLSDNMLLNSDGELTDFGYSKMAIFIKQLENAREEVKNYSDDIENLNKLYEDSQYTEDEYKEKLSELQTELLGSAQSVQSYTNSIIDLYKNAAQAELDSLFELIDARNEALQAKKDYYDYDKTIRNKTKDIQALQAQIAALEGVETAEAKAKKAQLAADLSDAQEELDDTINEHIFEMSSESLNNMKEVLQEAFDDKFADLPSDLDEIQSLLESAGGIVSSSASAINGNLSKLLEYYGIEPDTTGIDAAYASGTKYVPRKMTALTNENGAEIIVTKDGLITPLERGDGVIPAELTKRLYEMATGEYRVTPNVVVPKFEMPDIGSNVIMSAVEEAVKENVTQHYDALINIEGSADAATVEDLKALSKDLMEKSYKYTSDKLYNGYIRSGGKRKI